MYGAGLPPFLMVFSINDVLGKLGFTCQYNPGWRVLGFSWVLWIPSQPGKWYNGILIHYGELPKQVWLKSLHRSHLNVLCVRTWVDLSPNTGSTPPISIPAMVALHRLSNSHCFSKDFQENVKAYEIVLRMGVRFIEIDILNGTIHDDLGLVPLACNGTTRLDVISCPTRE